jgi:hypothetical protein
MDRKRCSPGGKRAHPELASHTATTYSQNGFLLRRNQFAARTWPGRAMHVVRSEEST